MPAHASRRNTSTVLRFGQFAALGTVAALILIAGVWASWGTAQHVMLTKGRERGTMTVTRCADDRCTGPYRPTSEGSTPRARVVLDGAVTVEKGRTYTVAVKPGSDDVVRTGAGGLLYAWVPLGGALLLASMVVAGGLRLTRLAWILGGTGLAMVTAAFLAL
ncbi:hypothetical protein [Streptomyces fructofermentans]|uniref:Uncharacterized protein n=1 Tax=Streptomyces fructofermentans TaxID=152141 RepID=A0A918U4R6_9ACTN|nr:hypothetical protein [Streptomyces fructofermentans]GGX92115.1 hypothetical protein GCM10010515_68980 [Streptomyces fructofermentans]